jgi:putative phosphoribosyl transferase
MQEPLETDIPGRFPLAALFFKTRHDPAGIVVFAHGSGSGRLSPRNQFVASQLAGAGLMSLLPDLLTEAEASARANVFDVKLLTDRLLQCVAFASRSFPSIPLGLFGASTGAAAALTVAVHEPGSVKAVVSRGGRPDLVTASLAQVKAPTLLIVGQRDEVVLSLNEQAGDQLKCVKELAIVPGATHLFEEPGALELVAELANRWFTRWLRSG